MRGVRKRFSRKFESGDAGPPPNVGPPPDVEIAFLRFSRGEPHMTPDQLLLFLVEFQGEGERTIEDAERICGEICGGSRSELTLEDFFRFLFSEELNPPIPTQVHHDMTAPLSHYYIYTGHNSYLTGNQLSSESSDAPIIKALQNGVKVIELDMWPNSKKDDVDILHGRTMTKPIKLTKCLESIKGHAFCASPYPVVITLEDHLTPDLQAKVAKMLTETFGEMLFYPESERQEEFPSPEFLRNRILISTKPPKEYLESKKSIRKKMKSLLSRKKHDLDYDSWDSDAFGIDTELYHDVEYNTDQSDEDDEELDQKLSQNAAPEYKDLIAIKAGKRKGGLRAALEINPNQVRRLSLSEPKLEKAAASYASNIVRFTQKNILRVYPKGTRFNSSNYNPFIGWMHGAQMVAFNMQGYGKLLSLMQGFFRGNGGCGYMKKSDLLMETGPNGVVFSPKAALPVKRTLKVKVYMSTGWELDFSKTHFDKFSPPDFYTRVGIAGLPVDSVMKKTMTIKDQWTPVWNQELDFPLRVPELSILRIEVMDENMPEKDDFGGQNCLPLSELRPGIRAVPLYDQKGTKYKSVKLLMRFDFSEDC